jgi:hypothetical protein
MNSFRFQQLEIFQRRSVAERHVPLSGGPLGRMKIYYFHILFIFSSVFYIGCTSTYIVATNSTESQRDIITINQLQQKLQDKTVKIILRDNQQVQAENITFSKDTATFTILPDLRQSSIPLVAIKKIEKRLHFNGAFVGVFYGSIFGAIIAEIIWNPLPSIFSSSSESFIDSGYFILSSIVAGGLYGGIRGNIEEYIFDSDIDKHAP